jgi:hypothetical protein
MGNFSARASGYAPALAELDFETRAAFESFAFPVSDEKWSEISAAPRFGGLGLLALAPFAPLALAACVIAALPMAQRLCPMIVGCQDLWLQESLRSSVVARFPLVEQLIQDCLTQAPARRPLKLQKKLCEIVGKSQFEERKAAVGGTRCSLLACPGIAGVFAPSPGEELHLWHNLGSLWFPPNVFFGALRMCLGIPFLPADSGPCPFCAAQVTDDLAYHVLNCKQGGGRQRAHTHLKQALFAAAAAASWAPRLEAAPFATDTGRVDVEAVWCGRRLLIDAAITSEEPTGYEPTKIARYGEAARRTDARMKVIPAVWHILGGAGTSAFKLTTHLALAVAGRFGVPRVSAIVRLRERLSARVLHAMGDIVVLASLQAQWQGRADAGG